MNIRFLIIIGIIVVAVPVGFYYFISVNGFSMHHAGIYVEILSEDQLEKSGYVHEIKSVTKDELEQFPHVLTMIELLVDEKDNPQGTRSFFVGADTYRIFDSRGELKIKNHMSDSDASDTHHQFIEKFGFNTILYDGNYFSISSWIA